uniref:Uncharacterized protein n=1 Tax=Arundo donax TaxID=35708 RepID=A0A0A9C9B4_ARUDO
MKLSVASIPEKRNQVPRLSSLLITGQGASHALGHRVVKHNILPAKPQVDRAESVELVLGVAAFLWIQEDLYDFCTIQMIPRTLPNDLSWIHDVLQNAVMNRGKSAAARVNNS